MDNKGAALGVALMLAVIGGIIAYGALYVAISQAQHARFYQERSKARYVAEAAQVIARERLWALGNYKGSLEPIDINGNGIDATDPLVLIQVFNTCAGPVANQNCANQRRIVVQRIY